MFQFSCRFAFLADRTNGRAIATLLRLSSVVVCRCLSVCDVMYCVLSVRPRAIVTM